MTTPVHGQGTRAAVAATAPQRTRSAWERITRIFAALLATCCAACSSASAPVLNEHLLGWQREHDAQTHAFAHDSFALNREVGVRAKALAASEALQWRAYAEPLLSMATRSRAVHQSQGRALVLERFLAHMERDPEVGATEAWFAGEIGAVRAAADEAGAETAAVADAFAKPQAMGEDTVLRIVAAAGREGTVRGEALQLADLRRSAGNYFRRLGYDKSTLAFDRGDASAPVPDERLVANAEHRLGWAGLRQAILAQRSCTRTDAAVTCAPAPPGTAAVEVTGEDQAVEMPSPQRSILPGETIRWFEPKVRAPDLLDRRPGW